jgi:RNase P protein component
MANAVKPPYYMQQVDHVNYGYKFVIVARLAAADVTFWKLKWA